MELECIVDFAGTADWRERKAEEYPEDHRNVEAARLLSKLAEESRHLEGTSLHHDIERLWEADDDFGEKISEKLRQVGFGGEPASAADFLRQLL